MSSNNKPGLGGTALGTATRSTPTAPQSTAPAQAAKEKNPLEDRAREKAEYERQFENRAGNWLTYESIYNRYLSTHTDEASHMGVYNMPLGKLRIIVASNVVNDEKKWDSLKSIFFQPDSLSSDDLKSLLYQPWADDRDDYDQWWVQNAPITAASMETAAQKKATGGSGKALLRARLPYNVLNNSSDSKALGSKSGSADLEREVQTWPMWQTASRSCFIMPDKPPLQAQPLLSDWTYLSHAKNIEQDLNQKGPASTAFDINQIGNCYSVKTGVKWVGKREEDKLEDNKSTLEQDAIVAAVRTEFMLAMDDYYLSRGDESLPVNAAKKELIILPEILTVTCIENKIEVTIPQSLQGGTADAQTTDTIYHDGFQLRDLSRLNKSTNYFPALSVPYVPGGGDLSTYKPVHLLTPTQFDVWNRYWSENYAARIGRVKAILHLVYGFAPVTPNMQNFVFEVDSQKPNGFKRTVLRDVLDFRLHTGWIRLALSNDSECDNAPRKSLCDPASPLNVDDKMGRHFRRLFNYEKTTESPGGEGSMLGTSEAGVYEPFEEGDIVTKYRCSEHLIDETAFNAKSSQVKLRYDKKVQTTQAYKDRIVHEQIPAPPSPAEQVISYKAKGGVEIDEAEYTALPANEQRSYTKIVQPTTAYMTKLKAGGITGEVPKGSASRYYSGLQLNFFAFSAVLKGENIVQRTAAPQPGPSNASTAPSPVTNNAGGVQQTPNPETAQWQRLYAVTMEWGLVHAAAFIAAVNEILAAVNKTLKVHKDPRAAMLKYDDGQLITAESLRTLKVKDRLAPFNKPNPLAQGTFTLESLQRQLNDFIQADQAFLQKSTNTTTSTTTNSNSNTASNQSTTATPTSATTATPGQGATNAPPQPLNLQVMHLQLMTWEFYVSGIIEQAMYQDKDVRELLRIFVRGEKAAAAAAPSAPAPATATATSVVPSINKPATPVVPSTNKPVAPPTSSAAIASKPAATPTNTSTATTTAQAVQGVAGPKTVTPSPTSPRK